MTNGWCQMFPIRQLNIEKTLIWSLICEQEGEGQDYLHAAVNVGKPNLLSLIYADVQYLTTSCTVRYGRRTVAAPCLQWQTRFAKNS